MIVLRASEMINCREAITVVAPFSPKLTKANELNESEIGFGRAWRRLKPLIGLTVTATESSAAPRA